MFLILLYCENDSYIYTYELGKNQREILGKKRQEMSYKDNVNKREKIHTYIKTLEQDHEKENDRKIS